MPSGVSIKYGDIAPEAKENFEPSASESEFGELYKQQLQQYNLNFLNYANPCELYQTVLDGTASAFLSESENENIGLWSKQTSNDDGTFTEPVVLELESVGLYSSHGLTLTFDTYNNIYANNVNIKWYKITTDAIEMLSNIDFKPDSAMYFCQNEVNYYNKVVITFYSLNMPKNRLKLRVIDYGYGTLFSRDELTNVKVIQEINIATKAISINTVDFELSSKSDMAYSFIKKQPLSTYFNDNLIQTTFVEKSQRLGERVWSIQSQDYIGLMEDVPFVGGIYIDKNAYDLLVDIFTVAKVPYSIDDIFKSMTVSGYIPYTDCREALRQVAFAVQAAVGTSNSETARVFARDDEIKQTIPLERIMQGQSFTDEETVTGVEITVHTYKEVSESVNVYEAAKSGTGENIMVKFSEPLHDLQITDGTFAIDKKGNEIKYANYAVINASNGCILSGQKYIHTTLTKRKNNPLTLESELEKVVTIDDATLVSSNNIDMVLEKCYAWLTRTRSTNLKIVEGKHISGGEPIKYGQNKYGTFKYGGTTPKVITYDTAVNLAENINAETEYLGTVNGRLIKQSFNLNGGIIIKEAVLK